MGIYFDKKIYGIRIVSNSDIILYEIKKDIELTNEEIEYAKNISKNNIASKIYIYIQFTSTYETAPITDYMWENIEITDI